MKTTLICTLLAVTSLSALAQQSRGSGPVYGPQNQGSGGVVIIGGGNGNYGNNGNWQQQPYQKPVLPKKVVDCMTALRPLSSNDWDLENRCRNDSTQKDAQEHLQAILACAQVGKQGIVKNFWGLNCLEQNYRSKLADPGYTSCLTKVKASSFEFFDDQFCSDTELRNLTADLGLKACVKFFDKDLGRAYGWQAVQVCRDSSVRASVATKPYKDCHTDLKKYNVEINEALSYCGQPQPKVAEGLGKVKSCIGEMTKIFGALKGLEICGRNLNLPEIASKENIACMNATLRYTSPGFTDLLIGSEAAQFMRDLTIDCKKPAVALNHPSLRYLNTFFIPSSVRVNNQEIGGLSGIAYDAKSARLLAVSDQRFQGKNYIFKFEMKDVGAGFEIFPEDKFLSIKPEFTDGKHTSRFDIDSEGLVLEPNGNIVVSSESLTDNDRSYIKIFTPAGKQVEAIELPQKFYNFKLEQVTVQEQVYDYNQDRNDNFDNGYNSGNGNGNGQSAPPPVRVHRGNGNGNADVTCYGNCGRLSGSQQTFLVDNGKVSGPNDNNGGIVTNGNGQFNDDRQDQFQTRTYVQRSFLNNQGVSENKGFEALGITRDGKSLFTANEAPLRQDRAKDVDAVRILKLERSPTFKPVAEYLYALEDTVDNGLVDILPINSQEILTLERGYDPQLKKVTVRIFRVNLSKAVDTLANETIFAKGFKFQTVKKELLIDLDTVIDSMPAGLRKLDNIEGMTWGPKTAQGADTLILVSDNNMTSKQRTLIMSFELIK